MRCCLESWLANHSGGLPQCGSLEVRNHGSWIALRLFRTLSQLHSCWPQSSWGLRPVSYLSSILLRCYVCYYSLKSHSPYTLIGPTLSLPHSLITRSSDAPWTVCSLMTSDSSAFILARPWRSSLFQPLLESWNSYYMILCYQPWWTFYI